MTERRARGLVEDYGRGTVNLYGVQVLAKDYTKLKKITAQLIGCSRADYDERQVKRAAVNAAIRCLAGFRAQWS